MLRTVILVTHVGAGAAGLLVGPAAMVAAVRNRRGTPAGLPYWAR